jgi:hypothetical protein
VIDRPKEPPKLDDDDDFGDAFPSERPTADGAQPDQRPTVSPPFDVEEFAKHSDSKLQAARTPHRAPSELPTGHPSELPTGHPSELPTNIPPDIDLPREFPQVARGRAPQITLTDEHEMEEARLRSVLMQSDPPPKRESGRPLQASERPTAAPDEPVEEAPKTRAYPSEYEKDPFAHLNAQAGSDGTKLGTEMSDRFSLGDYTGALEIAEAILVEDPSNAKAIKCADECKAKLIQMYTARIGPLDKVPMVMVAREQLRWLSIDHRAGFLLSHVDGVSSLEMILDVSGMPLLDALKILAELQQQRVISFR